MSLSMAHNNTTQSKMTMALGKRKRTAAKEKEEENDSAADLHALLQRHFESRFKPLETAPLRKPADSESDVNSDEEDDDTLSDPSEDEWSGVSDSDHDGKPNAYPPIIRIILTHPQKPQPSKSSTTPPPPQQQQPPQPPPPKKN